MKALYEVIKKITKTRIKPMVDYLPCVIQRATFSVLSLNLLDKINNYGNLLP